VAPLAPILQELQAIQPAWIEGDRVRIIDGNHHAATQRRLKVHQTQNAAPLPGLS
jgi:hypothetical protein